ncbi:MAG TPA: hypothetical protein VFT41_01985 [Gemmatimonadaceae bacterium]|nr:hypothetical protein [Gemmatimonadaceae bacterium]
MNALPLPGPRGRWRRLGPGAAGVLLSAAVVWLGFWLMERPLVRMPDTLHQGAPSEGTPAGATRGVPAADIMTRAGIPAQSAADLPGASRPAAAYAVELGDANTAAGAILRLQQVGASVPAGTYAPMPNQAAELYQVVAGAYPTSNAADAALQRLRASGQLSETSGTVVRVPLAFLIERDVAANAAAARVAAYSARGLPVYALRQADGRAWLYAGAFASAADTTPLGDALRRAGIHATLAYRTGRPF